MARPTSGVSEAMATKTKDRSTEDQEIDDSSLDSVTVLSSYSDGEANEEQASIKYLGYTWSV